MFPHTVQLDRQYREKGLAVVSISLDDPAEQPRVLGFLRQQQADFTNAISEFGTSPASADAFGIRGDLPFFQLYDRAGVLRYTFSPVPQGSDESVSQIPLRIEQLLGE